VLRMKAPSRDRSPYKGYPARGLVELNQSVEILERESRARRVSALREASPSAAGSSGRGQNPTLCGRILPATAGADERAVALRRALPAAKPQDRQLWSANGTRAHDCSPP